LAVSDTQYSLNESMTMKKALIIFVLLGGLYFSNPSIEDHQLAVKESLIELYKPSKQLAIFADIAAYGLASITVKRNDYYIFSLTEVKGATIGLGVLNHVFVFDRQLKKITNNK